MSISNYPELKSAISNWLARGDLDNIVSDLVTLAEARINNDVRTRQMEAIVTIDPVSLSPIESALEIPDNFMELKQIIVTSNDMECLLKYIDESSAALYLNNTSVPIFFSRRGDYFLLVPNPDSAEYTYSLYYYARIPALSDNNVTNWLLTNNPNIYLYASLLEASPYLKDDARIDVWLTAYINAVEKLNAADLNSKYPSSDLRIRGDVIF